MVWVSGLGADFREQLANGNFVSEMVAPSTVLISYPHPALNSWGVSAVVHFLPIVQHG
jgi:hypothetical protein